MASIMTNASAMTALRTLTATNKALDQTQARVSTGYRVAQASDNAAYWSIATTMRSDNMALSTVQDALGLGSATVDVAYTALESSKKVLDEIKSKLVAAKQPGVDRTKIQADITQLREQLVGTASASSFSGSNWLSIDSSSANYTSVQTIISSFSRSGDGTFNIGTVDVKLNGLALFDANPTYGALLEKGVPLAEDAGFKDVALTSGTSSPTAATLSFDAFAAVTLDDDDAIRFSVALNGGTAKTVMIDKATVMSALGSATGAISSTANMTTVLTKALTTAGFKVGASAPNEITVGVTSGAMTLTTVATGTAASLAVTGTATSNNGNFNTFGVSEIDITTISEAQLDTYIKGVDVMAERVTTAATELGAAKKRISLQTDFVKTLMDAIERGVGQLVDADMNEESTRLQALQTQQQLGVQALSIANTSSQNILKLFQG